MSAVLDRAFVALGHPTRRALLTKLALAAATVNELAEPFPISLPAISRHLRVLERASLVSQEREGQFRRYQVNGKGLKAAGEWLEFHRRFWNDSFERLDEHLRTTLKAKGQRRGTRHGKSRDASRKR
jgi:DNA-binding transcriptional ArsR family regulator